LGKKNQRLFWIAEAAIALIKSISTSQIEIKPVYLIQLLLPLRDNANVPFHRQMYDVIRRELTDRFGGVTAFLRSPAKGFWQKDDGAINQDDVVIVEVMADELDRPWWRDYREELERRFRQEELVVRASELERL
jgi:hypothetical protein